MTTSNTELAAQARAVAKALWTYSEFDFDGDFRNAANLLRQLADALETRGKPVVVWDSDGWGELLVDSLPDGTQLYTAPVQPEKDERKPLSAKQVLAAAACHERGRVVIASVQRVLRIGYREADELCRSIIDAGLVEGLEISPALQTSHGIGSSTEGGV